MRERVNDLGLGSCFQASVSVRRWGVEMGDSASSVIQRDDVLHARGDRHWVRRRREKLLPIR